MRKSRKVQFPTKDRTVEVLDPGTGKSQASLSGETGEDFWYYAALAISRDGKFLAAAHRHLPPGNDPPIKARVSVWDLTTLRVVADLERSRPDPLRKGMIAVSLTDDGKYLAGADRRGLCFWDVAARKEHVLAEVLGGFSAVAFAPEGLLLAAGDDSGLVTVWDVKTEKVVRKFEGHRAAIAGLAWTPDGAVLASSSADGSVLLWDATGKAPASAKPAPLTADQRRKLLDKAWDDLASPSAQTGYQAMLVLAAHPRGHLDLLKERLKPASAPDTLRVSRAVELLEYTGTPEAVAILQAFVKASSAGAEKADAARALERLDKRKAAAKE